ncbi:MAG: Depupylase [Fimbriimonadaceae bacterium]|nr:Depupylase [Fimbriimonadaceae bacterium]
MNPGPGDRIIGVETEFGCLVADETLGAPEEAVAAIKDYLFYELKVGAIDLHSRDEVFEPAQSGGFLINGARLYIDAVGSHLEYATAETRSLKDLVANDRAGQRLIVQAIRELDLQDQISVYNNSIDHFGGHTFGCHENYLVRMDEDFFSAQVHYLYGFLITRQIYAGVGRVGGHILTNALIRPSYQEVMEHPIDYIWVSQVYGVLPDPEVEFQLSQRADHILKTVASRVRFNRALINPKWEHYYSHDGMQRLHLLFGESNQSEYAYALKAGTTSLALRLLEDNALDETFFVAQPLECLRNISRDASYAWPVVMQDGSTVGAVELQRRYLALAERYRGSSEETDWVLNEWAGTLATLEKDPLSLGDRLDWVAKKKIVDEYRRAEGLSAQDDALHSVDLEYHNIDPDRSLFHALQEMGVMKRFITDLDILEAMAEPPVNTRAKGRAQRVQQVLARRSRGVYAFDWSGVALDRHGYEEMPDPYETYELVGP